VCAEGGKRENGEDQYLLSNFYSPDWEGEGESQVDDSLFEASFTEREGCWGDLCLHLLQHRKGKKEKRGTRTLEAICVSNLQWFLTKRKSENKPEGFTSYPLNPDEEEEKKKRGLNVWSMKGVESQKVYRNTPRFYTPLLLRKEGRIPDQDSIGRSRGKRGGMTGVTGAFLLGGRERVLSRIPAPRIPGGQKKKEKGKCWVDISLS